MWISNILTVGMTRQHTFPSVNPKTGEYSSGILVSLLALFWSAAAFVLVGMRDSCGASKNEKQNFQIAKFIICTKN